MVVFYHKREQKSIAIRVFLLLFIRMVIRRIRMRWGLS